MPSRPLYIAKPCSSGCSGLTSPCAPATDCVTDIVCREKTGSSTLGPPNGDGNYHNNLACAGAQGMSCHFTGTTHPFFSDWNLDYDFTWSLAGDHWEWSGSYSNYTGAYTDPGQNLRGTVDGSNVQPFSGSCVQVPNGAVFWVNSAPLYHPFGGTPCGRYTPGPLVSLDTAMAAALAAAAAAGDWADSADCNMEVTTPNSETGNFTYALKQPKAHMTGLTIGQFYQLKFNYQKYISGVWTDAYTLIVGFTATATEEYTAWIDTSEMFSLFPGQVRLDPACPARLVPITGD